MALVEPVVTSFGGGATLMSWTGAASGDTFAPLRLNGAGPLGGAAQVVGTFGTATAGIEVSNDGANWHALKELSASTIALTAAGLAEFSTGALFIRPSLSGTGASGMGFYVCARG